MESDPDLRNQTSTEFSFTFLSPSTTKEVQLRAVHSLFDAVQKLKEQLALQQSLVSPSRAAVAAYEQLFNSVDFSRSTLLATSSDLRSGNGRSCFSASIDDALSP